MNGERGSAEGPAPASSSPASTLPDDAEVVPLRHDLLAVLVIDPALRRRLAADRVARLDSAEARRARAQTRAKAARRR